MPLSAEQLKAIQGALGDDGAETFEAIKATLDTDASALDTVKGEVTKAKRDAAKTAKELEQARKDAEAAKAGESEALTATKAERDAAKAEAEALAKRHRDYRIKVKLADALGIADRAKRSDALKLFELPEGADLDDDGNLTGADDAIKSFRESRGYLFDETTEPNSVNGGSRKGSTPPPNPGKKADQSQTAKVLKWEQRLGYAKAQG